MDKRMKTVFQLDSPFTSSKWPECSTQDQTTILDLLIRHVRARATGTLLTPVGQWRSNNTAPSRGKRDKKRKRKRKEAKSGETQLEDAKPPIPEIASFLRVGSNRVLRTLQCSSNTLKPSAESPTKPTSSEAMPGPQTCKTAREAKDNPPNDLHGTSLAAVFVARQSPSSALERHFSQLIAVSATACPDLPAPRLVQLPPGSDAKLCEALGIARVSMIGLSVGAPHSNSLVELVRRCVPEVEIPWLQEARKAEYHPVKINAMETSMGAAKAKGEKVGGKRIGA
ncbi:hypothetical protein BJ875DRAFT_486465 [Amylocarpus encephaloides]|uniref:Uncharacterized protein n=1 Tax=Amylocarpus encephaloides TaxID=45428 RepID=A0A9P7YE90_9HELO|nr:hypothetical protein BJ875DRAFT_486465 [Amylocarpus encephaloides]